MGSVFWKIKTVLIWQCSVIFFFIFLFCTFFTINNFCLLFNSILPNIIDCNTSKSSKNTEIVVMKIYLSLSTKQKHCKKVGSKVIVLMQIHWFWFVEYCQTSGNKNKSQIIWQVTNILTCCIFWDQAWKGKKLLLIW